MKNSIIVAIGFVASFLTTVSFLPQSIKTIKTRHTDDMSIYFLLLLVCGITMWIFYGILLKSAPLIVGNGITLILTLPILYIKINNINNLLKK